MTLFLLVNEFYRRFEWKKAYLSHEWTTHIAFKHSETELEVNSTPSSLMKTEGKDFQICTPSMSHISLSWISFQQVV